MAIAVSGPGTSGAAGQETDDDEADAATRTRPLVGPRLRGTDLQGSTEPGG